MTLPEIQVLDELKQVALTQDKAIRRIEPPHDVYGKTIIGYEKCYQILNARNEVIFTTDLPGLCQYFNYRVTYDSFHMPVVNMTI